MQNLHLVQIRVYLGNISLCLGLSKEVYEERVTKIALNCAQFAKEQDVKYIELSTAQVYGSAGKMAKVGVYILHTLYMIINIMYNVYNI